MSKTSEYFWTPEQLGRLKDAYDSGGGLKAAEAAIPEKTRGTLATKACREGLTKKRPRHTGVSHNNSPILGTLSEKGPDNPMFGTLTSSGPSRPMLGTLSD